MTREKKIQGRKRHLVVDTMGFIIEALVHTANIQDRDGGRFLLTQAKRNGAPFHTGFADGGYQGSFVDWAHTMHGVTIKIVKRSDLKKFVVLPKRWIVERSFGWFGHNRRLAKDYEKLPENSETVCIISALRHGLNCLMYLNKNL